MCYDVMEFVLHYFDGKEPLTSADCIFMVMF